MSRFTRVSWKDLDATLRERPEDIPVLAYRFALRTAQEALADHPMVAHAGFLHDAEKEYAEARLCAAMVRGEALASPAELGVMAHSWMRGLAEAASELRRSVLDRLRAGDLEGGEALLEVMDDDFNTPEAIARIAMMVPTPWKLRLSSGISPVRISQIASKSMPRFLLTLIAIRRASPRVKLS